MCMVVCEFFVWWLNKWWTDVITASELFPVWEWLRTVGVVGWIVCTVALWINHMMSPWYNHWSRITSCRFVQKRSKTTRCECVHSYLSINRLSYYCLSLEYVSINKRKTFKKLTMDSIFCCTVWITTYPSTTREVACSPLAKLIQVQQNNSKQSTKNDKS